MTTKATNVSEGLAAQMRVYAIGLRGENDLKVGPHMAAQMLEEGAFAIDRLATLSPPLPSPLGVERTAYGARQDLTLDDGPGLAEARQLLGMTQQQLASHLEVTPEHVCRVEKGKRAYTKVMRLAVYALSALPLLEDRL